MGRAVQNANHSVATELEPASLDQGLEQAPLIGAGGHQVQWSLYGAQWLQTVAIGGKAVRAESA
jgi:hypothetical protein